MTSGDVEDHSRRLRDAERVGTPVEPLVGIAAGDIDTAYAVQLASVAAWLDDGRRVVGHKIGLTNPKVQAQLGVDRPDFGVLFADMRFGSGDVVPRTRVLQPRVEAEMALITGRDLDDPDLTPDDLADAIDTVHAAIEIVGSRIADWRISIVDTIADNASSGAFVIADRGVPINSVDLTGASMQMRRESNGVTDVVSTGSGADCLGSPLIAAHWLVAELARRGTPVRAGHTILSGALGPMVPALSGDSFTATIDGLGEVTTRFE